MLFMPSVLNFILYTAYSSTSRTIRHHDQPEPASRAPRLPCEPYHHYPRPWHCAIVLTSPSPLQALLSYAPRCQCLVSPPSPTIIWVCVMLRLLPRPPAVQYVRACLAVGRTGS